MKKDTKQSLWLLTAFIILIVCSFLFGGCATTTMIDSDPFFGSDTVYQQQNIGCFTIKTTE